MNDILRQEIATAAHTVVIKVGTRVLTNVEGTLDTARIARLSEEIHQLLQSGRRVALVSSGAVGAGLSQLGLKHRPNDVAQLQAVAAIGQAKLIEAYDNHFRHHGRHAAQILLTADDLNDRTRYLNVRNTLLVLFKMGAVPIINENDTVAVDELMTTFGDNDRLAAMVTNLLRAPLLVILSDVDGLYDGDPADPSSQRVSTVTNLGESIMRYVRDRKTGHSKGGMESKLHAARIATAAGENVIIASGHQTGVVSDIMLGKPVGTLFLAQGKSVSPWKRWIGFSAQPKGRLLLDAGAHRAISDEGRSLLAIGILSAEGDFKKGDVVSLCDPDGKEFARGLTNYPANAVRQIQGQKSDRIAEVLGHRPYEEVMHRDNIALTGP
jgi:glutamate 5-kinase